MRNNKIKNEIDEIRKWEEKINRKDLNLKQINIYIILNNMKE